MGEYGRKAFLEQVSQEDMMTHFEQLLGGIALGQRGAYITMPSRRECAPSGKG